MHPTETRWFANAAQKQTKKNSPISSICFCLLKQIYLWPKSFKCTAVERFVKTREIYIQQIHILCILALDGALKSKLVNDENRMACLLNEHWNVLWLFFDEDNLNKFHQLTASTMFPSISRYSGLSTSSIWSNHLLRNLIWALTSCPAVWWRQNWDSGFQF